MQLKIWITASPLIDPFKRIIIWTRRSIVRLECAFLTLFHDLAHAESSNLVAQQHRTDKAPLATRVILSSDTITSGAKVLLRARPQTVLMCCNENFYHSFSVCGSRLAAFDCFS